MHFVEKEGEVLLGVTEELRPEGVIILTYAFLSIEDDLGMARANAMRHPGPA